MPTKIKKLKGTLQECRENKSEPAPPALKQIPDPPEHFNEIAKGEWYRVVGQLISLKLLSNMDLALIEVYCREYAIYVEMNELLDQKSRVMVFKDEKGNMKHAQVAPHQRIADRAVEKMLKIAAEFGFTPSARTRINADILKSDNKTFDEFSDL